MATICARGALSGALVALLLLSVREAPAQEKPGPAAKKALTKEAPELPLEATPTRINQAIDRGVQYLRTHSWEHPVHGVGYSALAGLTLLECGVPADDKLVQRAAGYVRSSVVSLGHTYQIALSILFLDRLGQPEDERIIQGLALRLLAGQTAAGGWDYGCPLLPAKDMAPLFQFLRSHRPPALQKMLPGEAKAGLDPLKQPAVPGKALASQKQNANDPFRKFGEMVELKAIPAPKGVQQAPADSKPGPNDDAPAAREAEPMKLEALPQHLRKLPIVVLQGQSKSRSMQGPGKDDNSNTQFALLALWVARRHDVPTEQALLLAQLRFLSSQGPLGQWTYSLTKPRLTPAMTAVGLLGLAMGHGVGAELEAKTVKAPKEDPNIQKGLLFLAQAIGMPARSPAELMAVPPLYFLWSVERVGVLYDLKTLGGKDWYAWGAQLLVLNQRPDGAWFAGGYPGSSAHIDTCLALLFLKRANLVQDLTANLRNYLAIRDPAVESAGKR